MNTGGGGRSKTAGVASFRLKFKRYAGVSPVITHGARTPREFIMETGRKSRAARDERIVKLKLNKKLKRARLTASFV